MRLLQPKEVESKLAEEEAKNQYKANALRERVTELVKKFNLVQEEIKEKEKVLFESHKDFCDGLNNERKDLEGRVKELEHQKDIAMEPLYRKELVLNRQEESLNERTEEVSRKETNVKFREQESRNLEKACEIALATIEEKEKNLKEKDKEFSDREAHFVAFRQRQEKLFKQDQQKLRDWFEKERAKLRK